MSKILDDIKVMLNIEPDIHDFDLELKVYIQSAMTNLHQIGILKESQLSVDLEETDWSEFGLTDLVNSNVKNYIFLKTKKEFDPPSNSSLGQAIDNQIKELEWRLNVVAEGAFDKEESWTNSSRLTTTRIP